MLKINTTLQCGAVAKHFHARFYQYLNNVNAKKTEIVVPPQKMCFIFNKRHYNTKVTSVFKKELKAVCALIKRSQPDEICTSSLQSVLKRGLHTSQVRCYFDPPKRRPEDDLYMKHFWINTFACMILGYVFITVTAQILDKAREAEMVRSVSWNEFVYQMLAKGIVQELDVRSDIDTVTILLKAGAVVNDEKADGLIYRMNVADLDRLEDRLRETERQLGVNQRIDVVYTRTRQLYAEIVTALMFFGFLYSIFYVPKSIKSRINMDYFNQLGRAKYTLVDPVVRQRKRVTFEDVAGLKEAKIEVMEFVGYLKRPEYYKSLGAKLPKGALLLGPPGCGKTLLAKAVAAESNVPFLSMNGSEFIEVISGLGAARVRNLFREASRRAPCIVYIDEIDALGKCRTGTESSTYTSGENEQTLNQLLVEMDGMSAHAGVLLLASTNRADILDKALLRPGRFDRHILIDYPTLEEREEIFQTHLKSIVLEHNPRYYAKRLSYQSAGFSGADIANVCNEAALHAARLKESKVTRRDLEYAVERLVCGPEKKNHMMSPREKNIVAYHESGHALVGWLLEHTDALLKVTIVPRTSLALGFAQYGATDKKLYSKEELFDRMCMALGGRVAEALKFNSITTGATSDLESVTRMAYAQIREYGMCEAVGLISFDEDSLRSPIAPYSKTLKNLIDLEARKLVAKAYYRTEHILMSNYFYLELLSQNLLIKETLYYSDIERLIGSPRHGKKRLIEPFEFEALINNTATERDDRQSDDKTGNEAINTDDKN